MDSDGTPAIPPVSGAPKQSGVVYTPPENPSQYIRTFAKDVAALTNTPIPTSAAPAKPAEAPQQGTGVLGKSTDMGVTVDELDASPVNRSESASPKEFAQEVVALSQDDSEGVFANTNVVKPSEPVQTSPFKPITPTPPVTTSTKTEESDRAAILARLRAKLATQESPVAQSAPEQVIQRPSEPVPAPRPEPVIAQPAPEPMPSRTAAPQFETSPVTPPLPKTPEPTPIPVSIPRDASPAPMHTFSSDFADRIDTRGASTFSVLAAQSDARQTVVRTPRRTSMVPLIAGIALVIGGIGLAAGAFIFGSRSSDVPYVAGVPSLVRFDESVEVRGEGTRLIEEIVNVANGGVVNGNAVVTYVTAQQEGESGILSTPAPGGVLIAALGLPTPAILLRNLDRSSTVGVINAGGETRPFLVLKATSYERTFAGMLAWEPTMARDLAALFPQNTSLILPIETSTTSSSTIPQAVAPTPMPFFVDVVIANHDARALRDSSGGTILVYGYHGKDILIIARNEAAFTALVNRLIPTTTQ